MAGSTSAGIISGMNPLEFTSANPFPLFAIQLCLILVVVRLVHYPLSFLRQPRVIAEVVTGIILGPTALCRVSAFKDNVFPDASLPFINLVATFGLVFFLFLVGLELDPRHMTRNVKRTMAVAVSGMAVPFAAGMGVSILLYHYIPEENRVSLGSFLLFCGIAISITAFPVLARILAELNLLKTPVGSMTISAAAVNDAVAWILLALVISIVNASSGINALYIFLVAIGFVLFLVFVVRRGVFWLIRRQPDIAENGPNQLTVMIIFLMVLISAFFTDVLGIHPIFGGFAVGVIMPHDYGFAVKLTEKIEDFISILFLPLYFTPSGLKTQIGLINDGKAWGYVVLVCVVAIGGKVIGSAVAARSFKTSWRESLAIGFLMNCKGLVELIALNLGLEAGVLDGRTFAILVLMALVTTFITTPMVLWIYP
ncbi:Cation/H+ exchanger, partial [Piptocephalis cylindrospora]